MKQAQGFAPVLVSIISFTQVAMKMSCLHEHLRSIVITSETCNVCFTRRIGQSGDGINIERADRKKVYMEVSIEELNCMQRMNIMDLKREELANAEDIVIDTQKSVESRIRSFIEQTKNPFAQNVEIYDIYVDDGWPGANFRHPGMQNMLEMVYARTADAAGSFLFPIVPHLRSGKRF